MNIKDNISKIIGAGIALATVGLGIFKLLSNKEIQEYSDEWFESLSDDELDGLRKEARHNWLHPSNDLHESVRWESIMEQFDNEKIKRMNEKFEREHPNAVTVSHSNGWHLESDD